MSEQQAQENVQEEALFSTSEKHRLPNNLRKFLIRLQGNKLYLPAQFRVLWFRDEHPDWGISTELVEGGQDAGYATVKASIFNSEGKLIASDYKTETKSDFPAGWVEKAATGAVARALAMAGFGTQFMPEVDDDGSRPADSPREMPAQEHRDDTRHRQQGRFNNNNSGNQQRNAFDRHPSQNQQNKPAINTSGAQCPKCHAPNGKAHSAACERISQGLANS